MVKSITDSNGLTIRSTYDGFGRKTETINTDDSKTTFKYLDSTNCGGSQYQCSAGSKFFIVATTTGNNVETLTSATYVDAFERPLREQSTAFDGTNTFVDSHYRNSGQLSGKTNPYSSTVNLQTPVNLNSVPYTSYDYNHLMQVTLVTHASGNTVKYGYLGAGITTVDDANGLARATSKTYNSYGKLSQVRDAHNEITRYTYDALDNIATITDPLSNVQRFEHDNIGNRIAVNDPDMGLWVFRYNAFGELKWYKDAKSQITTSEYDMFGRITRRDNSEGLSQWVYDEAAFGVGKLSNVRGPDGYQESYTYDNNGRLSSAATTINAETFYIRHTYDGYSRPNVMTYPGDVKIKQRYKNGFLSAVENATDNTAYWTAITRNTAGQANGQKFGNGLISDVGYNDSSNRIDDISTGTTANPTSVQNLSYQYEKTGDLKSRTDEGKSETFRYDLLGRITQVSSAITQSMTLEYNAIGNITYKSDVGFYYYTSSRPHAITETKRANYYTNSGTVFPGDANADGLLDGLDVKVMVNDIIKPNTAPGNPDCNRSGGETNVQDVMCLYKKYMLSGTYAGFQYRYDGNGNITRMPGKLINYTSFNKPETVTNQAAGLNTEFQYSADQNRVLKVIKQGGLEKVRTSYLGKFYEKTVQPNGTTEKYFIMAEGQLVAVLNRDASTVKPSSPEPTYQHVDYQGTITATSNMAGVRTAKYTYDAFGARYRSDTGTGMSSIVSNMTRGYTGHEMDDENDFINMNARIYDPRLGRFLTPDTIIPDMTDPQALNRYSYVLNNPMKYVDPSGHVPEDLFNFDDLSSGDVDYFDGLNSLGSEISSFTMPMDKSFGTVGEGFSCDSCLKSNNAGGSPGEEHTISYSANPVKPSTPIKLGSSFGEFKSIEAGFVYATPNGKLGGAGKITYNFDGSGAFVTIGGATGNEHSVWLGASTSLASEGDNLAVSATIAGKLKLRGVSLPIGVHMGGGYDVDHFEKTGEIKLTAGAAISTGFAVGGGSSVQGVTTKPLRNFIKDDAVPAIYRHLYNINIGIGY